MTDWGFWQASWDEQQESYLPDREERFAAMLDAVEGVVGTSPRVRNPTPDRSRSAASG